MNKHIWYAWAIRNSVCIITWAALAVYFDKWWIALFSALFLSSVSAKTTKEDDQT